VEGIMANIRVEEFSESSLKCRVWEFWFYADETALILDYYAELEKPTKRHKFRITKEYRRLLRRGNDFNEEEIPLPDSVKLQALKQFQDKISVRKWRK